MMSDFFTVLYWWILLLALGVLAWPITMRFFASFWDKGWVLSKTLGIIGLSYAAFLLGRAHFLPFSQQSLFLIIVVWLVVFTLNNFRAQGSSLSFSELKKALAENWKKILVEEILFLVALTFWSVIRGFQPNIEGLEKFMDFGFVNSILRSRFFPPADMWFAGEAINYYYFGHLQAAVLTKLAGLDSVVTYNLMMATVFSLTAISAFSLCSNMVYLTSADAALKTIKIKIKLLAAKKNSPPSNFKMVLAAGLIAGLLISLGGNLHAAIYTLKNGGSSYWYPDATRFIGYNPNNPRDKTIHEFPAYSFVVSDLHGHMNNIPTVFLFLSLLLAAGSYLFRQRQEKKPTGSFYWQALFLSGGLLGIMYMTNSWAFPIYGVIFAFFTLAIYLATVAKKPLGDIFTLLIKNWLPQGLLVLFVAIIVSLPFSLSFSPMADGIAPVNARSLWWQLLVLWGFFWFLAVSFWLWAGNLIIRKRGDVLRPADIFVIVATLWSTVLIIIPEFVYVKDIYIAEYHRANTMFKLVFESFVMYAALSGYIFWRVRTQLTTKGYWFAGGIYLVLFAAGFVCHMIYPYYSIKGYYGKLTKDRYQGLSQGISFLKNQYPGDYDLVLWLKKRVEDQPVVLEAVGDSYTLYDRISAMTGLPTVEGWLVHEWLWRGGYDKPGNRASEVSLIYQGDKKEARRLIDKYEVKYVVVGALEKTKYPGLDEGRFAEWGEEVFASGETKLYRLTKAGIN